jgi:hypothetical protein
LFDLVFLPLDQSVLSKRSENLSERAARLIVYGHPSERIRNAPCPTSDDLVAAYEKTCAERSSIYQAAGTHFGICSMTGDGDHRAAR